MLFSMRACIGALLILSTGIYSAGACPRNVAEKARRCTEGYTSYYQSIEANRGRLYSGIDVEELRQLCSEFSKMASCFTKLQENCSPSVSKTLHANLDGVVGIHGICFEPGFIEKYAIEYQCLNQHSRASDICYNAYTANTTTSFSRAYNGEQFAMRHICSSGTEAVECIEENIRVNCGKEPAKLMNALVRPTLNMGDIRCDLLDAQVTTAAQTTSSVTEGKHLSVYSGQTSIVPHWTVLLVILFSARRTI